jgi:hypothetical protein
VSSRPRTPVAIDPAPAAAVTSRLLFNVPAVCAFEGTSLDVEILVEIE